MVEDSTTCHEVPPELSGCVSLCEHSNENLLKFDTHDKYSTVTSIKKKIIKGLPPPKTNAPPEPLFKGLVRMGKNPKSTILFMAFETPEDSAAAAHLLCGFSVRRNKQWVQLSVTEQDLQHTHKGGNRKRSRDEENLGQSKVTKWDGLTMEEQLLRKKTHCLNVMRVIAPSVNGNDFEHLFAGIYASPELSGYRNHVHLSFGFTDDGEPSIGFFKGAMIDGVCTIDSVVDKDIVTMNPLAKEVALAVFSVYKLFSSSEMGALRVFDKMAQRGFWRKLQVRHNVLGEIMVDVELDIESVEPSLLSNVISELSASLQSNKLKERLQKISGKDTAAVVSAQFHHATGIKTTPHEVPRQVIFGTTTLVEHLAGLQFELSPTSFFQVNTAGMELLLHKTVELAELSPRTTLLDLCCGTGTIGLTLAKCVKRVIGIELMESAVKDAKSNASRNDATNVMFYSGRVEHVLPQIISTLPLSDKADIVAILDPPRAGITSSVLRWIRGTATIRRVVYISCEQKALERDIPPLTKPATNAYSGLPFLVEGSFAVDLFPHTPHVEMVVVLARQCEK